MPLDPKLRHRFEALVDFAVQRAGERVQDGLAHWHELAAGNCAIDYGFHQIVGGVDADSLAALPGLIDEGISSFKMFMAYPGVFYADDAQILRAMQVAADTGLLTMMHAENGPVIDVLAELDYVAFDDDGAATLTAAGRTMRRIYGERDLLVAESLRRGLWRELDPAEYPFVHHVVEEFAGHDDAEQFRAGLDLLLTGLRLQAKG